MKTNIIKVGDVLTFSWSRDIKTPGILQTRIVVRAVDGHLCVLEPTKNTLINEDEVFYLFRSLKINGVPYEENKA